MGAILQLPPTLHRGFGDVLRLYRLHFRSIHLKKLDGNTNVDVLAQGIIDRCEIIHPSRLPKLIELLSDMQVRIVEEEKKMESAAESVCLIAWGCGFPQLMARVKSGAAS